MDNKSFDSKRIAEGYAKRPWLHKEVIEIAKRDLGLEEGFMYENGLDVGCGAGLSTKALKLIAKDVTGTDVASSMIDVCKELYGDDSYTFFVAKAEETPIPSKKYDIVTAAGCINWVDRDKFQKNMREILSPGGIVLIYDFAITNRMVGVEEYTTWYNEEYLKRFPKPPRNEDVWTDSDLIDGLKFIKQVNLEFTYSFSKEAFVDFMMIQSNVNSRIENGEVTAKEVKAWMMDSLEPVFEGEEKKLIFSGYSWYIAVEYIETDRLIMRRLRPDDYLAMSAWDMDERVYKYLLGSACKTPEEPLAWLPKKDPNSKTNILMLVMDKEDGHAVGIYALNHVVERDVWTLSYVNRYDDWGKGYTTEGMNALMEHAACVYGARTFEGECAKENVGSAKVLKKLGMKYDHSSSYSKNDGSATFESDVYVLEIEDV